MKKKMVKLNQIKLKGGKQFPIFGKLLENCFILIKGVQG
jgi:hypothetical protein